MVKELRLIYSESRRGAFEVYGLDSDRLLGLLTFVIKDGKPGEFCFTPTGGEKGHAQSTILGALREYFKTEVRLHFPFSIS